MVQPLRVDQFDNTDSDIETLHTEIGELPDDFTDEINQPMTEVVPRESVAELDENADRWDRLLRLDRKADAKIDKDWLRAARGQSEYGRFGLWAAAVIVAGLVVGWQADVQIQKDFNVPFFAPTEPAPEAGLGDVTKEPIPEPLPIEPEPTATSSEETPEVAPVVPAEPPKPEAVPAPAPKASPAPSPPKAKAKPAPRKSKPKAKQAPSPAPKASPPPEASPAPATPPPAPPPPAATPAPAEPAAPSTAGVRVTGDAHQVQLVSEGQRISGGRVPPGSYNIEVRFRPGDTPQQQGSLTIAAGETALINCKASFYRCTVRGPWK